MPLIRKIIAVGNSRCISLPKSWLEYYEKKFEKQITHVSMETEGELLKIRPYIEKREAET